MSVTTGAFAFTPTVSTGSFAYTPSIKDSSFNETTGKITFTASGTFTAPSTKVLLNKRGKIDVYLTACAAGGAGGTSSGVDATSPDPDNGWNWGTQHGFSGGGQGGDYTHRYKIELRPGEKVAVTIPTSSGGSFVFGSYLTLSGGAVGRTAAPGTSATAHGLVGHVFISGSLVNENGVREGAAGCRGGTNPSWYNNPSSTPADHQNNNVIGNYVGIGAGNNTASGVNVGGGGAGLFGNGGNQQAAAASNTGAGGGGAATIAQGNPAGGSGQCYLEWRVLT